MTSPFVVPKPDIGKCRRTLLWTGDTLSSLALGLAAAALLSVVAFNAINIVLRYLLAFAVSWAQEAMLYLTIFGVYVGAVSVAWQQAHIRIDAIVSLAPPAWRGTLNVVSTILVVIILIPVALASYRVVDLMLEFDERSDALHVPMWIPQSIVPISLLLIALMAIVRLIVPLKQKQP